MGKSITFQLKDEEYIPLIQLLKATGVAETGGHAQELVMDGQVSRDGVTEYRKRAKIRPGETVQCGEVTILVQP